MKHISTRQLALCAVLTALALGLSTLENLFPVTLLIPLPGVKLGLANIVTVFALYQLGALPALAILTARCLLGGLFAGNASAMLFSLLGGLTAMLVMILLRRLRCLSIYGVSIGGAAARAFSSQGQTRTAALSLKLAQREIFFQETGEWPVLLLDENGLPLYGAALSETARDFREIPLDKAAVVVGSEGNGLSTELLAICDGQLIIPMRPDSESLNAGVAASVIMWEMSRGSL